MSDQYGQLQGDCAKTVEHFKRDLGKMRTGRAQTGLVENLLVDYYGASVPLIQLGMINTPEPRLLTIQVYDANAVASIEKAIMQSDLGLNPSRDGNIIRLLIPALTDERRRDLVKKLHKVAEEARISIRNHRRDAIDLLKKQEKEKDITEDELHRGQAEIQKITDKYISEVDSLLGVKEKEMLEV